MGTEWMDKSCTSKDQICKRLDIELTFSIGVVRKAVPQFIVFEYLILTRSAVTDCTPKKEGITCTDMQIQ